MPSNANATALIEKRLLDCCSRRRALEMWLGMLKPLRWITVIGSVSLSAIAGAAFLTKTGSSSTGPLVAGICAITASILSLLHTTFKCDEHQANCARLIGSYESLEASFETLQLTREEPHESEVKMLENRYEELVAESAAIAPARFLKHARQEIKQT